MYYFGAIFGILIDILGGSMVGQTAFAYGVIGLLGGYFDKTLSKDSKITVILLVMGMTAVSETFLYLYRTFMMSLEVEIGEFIRKILIETIYNGLLTIILYPLMQRFGYKMEEVFKNPQILTRYY